MVLSTKTLDSGMLAFANTQNLQVECVDFIDIVAVCFDIESIDPEKFDAIAFTSAHAVEFFFENNQAPTIVAGKQIFALQGKTKDSLLAKGVKANITATSADGLADAIIIKKSAKRVLHVCGSLKLPVLEEKLKKAGMVYEALTVYETITRPGEQVSGHFDAILFYSPSGVTGFLAKNNIEDKTVCCCIGPTTAHALKQEKSNATIIVPAQPSPLAMLATVADYLKSN